MGKEIAYSFLPKNSVWLVPFQRKMFEAQLLPSPAPQGRLHVTCRNPS